MPLAATLPSLAATLSVLVTLIAVVANAGIALADVLRADFVLANSAEVHVKPSWLPALAALKGAGAVGLLLGLFGLRTLGIAAATGLVLFYVGAVAVHVRARVFRSIGFPGAFLLLAVGSLVVAVARA
ncbi:DoxX family protein [Streptomyces sp. NPDC012769]|uniref:DoxX family protein n=1 Tax=Streptomyces sp. NPDC012769 TaxID=3364848 RepID=UPI0036BC6AE1